MCPQLSALDLSLKLQEIYCIEPLNATVMERLSKPDFNINQLAGWATKIIMKLGFRKDKERRTFDGLDPELLSYIGLGRKSITMAHESLQKTELIVLSRKRSAYLELDSRPKRLAMGVSAKDSENGLTLEINLVAKVEDFLSQIVITDAVSPRTNTETDKKRNPNQRRSRSWKKKG